ncbi:MAG: hypothetical protein HY897_19175 [Deltaproteobacteria bacterium]|nr:hypothetical protein [Deltaproteobacteria bacterium]
MPTKSVPADVQEEVARAVERFNKKELARWGRSYVPRFRGGFLFLDRDDGGGVMPICRLKYTGDMKKWGFAIYKYSSDRYDPEEWFFPGSDLVDGTVEGAMRAGVRAYE